METLSQWLCIWPQVAQMVDIVQAKGQKWKSVRHEKSVAMSYAKFMNDNEEASALLV